MTDPGGDSQSYSGQTCSFTPVNIGNYSVTLTTSFYEADMVLDTEAATICTADVPPTWTSGNITGAMANVDQTYNLPAVTFHDLHDIRAADSSHTAQVNWGDGTVTDSEVDQAPTDPNDPTQGLDGTIYDSHTYAAPGTYTATIALTDDAGESISKSFSVTVVNPDIALTSFTPSPDTYHSDLQVQYMVSGVNSAPFNIGIYASSDGTSPDQLLTSYSVNDSSKLAVSALPYTVDIPVTYADPQESYHLIAVADAAPDNSLEFAGGIFEATDNTVTPNQPYICVFGTAAERYRAGRHRDGRAGCAGRHRL